MGWATREDRMLTPRGLFQDSAADAQKAGMHTPLRSRSDLLLTDFYQREDELRQKDEARGNEVQTEPTGNASVLQEVTVP